MPAPGFPTPSALSGGVFSSVPQGRNLMVVLGIVLLVLGYVLLVPILQTLGIVLVIIGAVLWIAGAAGRPVGGRRYWW